MRLLLLLVGCAALTAEERQRALAMPASKDEPPPTCLNYGYAQSGVEASQAAALDNLKLQAFRRDANYLVPESLTRRGDQVVVSGRIYKCSEAALASTRPPAPIAPPVVACIPDCSPGYVCISGKCISACNPLCEKGERCGADRICHHAD